MAIVKNTAAKVVATTESAVKPAKPVKAASAEISSPETERPIIRRKQLAALVAAMVKKSGMVLPMGLAEQTLLCVDMAIEQALLSGTEVQLSMGRFYLGHSDARVGRNPQTGADMQIPAKVLAKFKPSIALKRKLNADLEEGDEEAAEAETAEA